VGEDSDSYAPSSPHQENLVPAEYPARCHPDGPAASPESPLNGMLLESMAVRGNGGAAP
jgi:hypothetical protein